MWQPVTYFKFEPVTLGNEFCGATTVERVTFSFGDVAMPLCQRNRVVGFGKSGGGGLLMAPPTTA